MAKRRVVVTGLGLLTSLGHNVPDTWRAICQGKSGVSTMDHIDTSDITTHIASSIKDFDPSSVINVKDLKKMDLFVQYAMMAAEEAMQDSQLDLSQINLSRIGTSIGSGIGGLPAIEKYQDALRDSGPRKVSPFFIPSAIINMASGNVSIRYSLKGPSLTVVTACTTGTHSIGVAARTIAYGDADIMVAGGAEMATCRLGISGFVACRALSKRNDEPEKASRPWDKDRDGFVMGDGAGILILEEYEHAKKRGANIYAEVIGFGMSSDAYHMTLPDPDASGFVACMENAIQDAGIDISEIDYINAHGTSTKANDATECLAIKTLFGEHAYNLAVSSTKSMIGHLLGAAGAVEAVFSILAIRDNIAPPTINLDNPDEGFDLNFVAHQAQERPIKTALSNSFGFGGTNGTIIFRAV